MPQSFVLASAESNAPEMLFAEAAHQGGVAGRRSWTWCVRWLRRLRTARRSCGIRWPCRCWSWPARRPLSASVIFSIQV